MELIKSLIILGCVLLCSLHVESKPRFKRQNYAQSIKRDNPSQGRSSNFESFQDLPPHSNSPDSNNYYENRRTDLNQGNFNGFHNYQQPPLNEPSLIQGGFYGFGPYRAPVPGNGFTRPVYNTFYPSNDGYTESRGSGLVNGILPSGLGNDHQFNNRQPTHWQQGRYGEVYQISNPQSNTHNNNPNRDNTLVSGTSNGIGRPRYKREPQNSGFNSNFQQGQFGASSSTFITSEATTTAAEATATATVISGSTPVTAQTPRPPVTQTFMNCVRSCPTTMEYNPVCGSDGENYHNQQRLQCAARCGASVQMVRRGTCLPL